MYVIAYTDDPDSCDVEFYLSKCESVEFALREFYKLASTNRRYCISYEMFCKLQDRLCMADVIRIFNETIPHNEIIGLYSIDKVLYESSTEE